MQGGCIARYSLGGECVANSTEVVAAAGHKKQTSIAAAWTAARPRPFKVLAEAYAKTRTARLHLVLLVHVNVIMLADR
jgi:hypothetical protein